MADKLEQVAIRMVEQPPLYSNEPMNNPDVAIRVMNEFLSQMDRELFCIVNLQADLTPINSFCRFSGRSYASTGKVLH